ncbi:MAG: DUF4142 domain-containing protein [Fimbriimonadaceae bacterium]|nr:DUF4142 domain-containing protein [Fimbriimonadaceae bacterium]QYK56898.1 MAG: DUF4142 domain-containing protein [Fimbriimonadaceae bacterium]
MQHTVFLFALALTSPFVPEGQTRQTLPPADRKAVMEAAQGNMAEVRLGKLAQQKGSSAFVRDFGRMMVRDHGAAYAELQRIEREYSLSFPRDISAKHKAVYNRLSKLSGTAFDRAYRAEMRKDHERDVKVYTKNSRVLKNDDVRGYFVKNLPAIEMHLRIIKEGRMPTPH